MPAPAPREMLSAAFRAWHRLPPANPRTGPPPSAAQSLESRRRLPPLLRPQHRRRRRERGAQRVPRELQAGRCAGRRGARKSCASLGMQRALAQLPVPADLPCSHSLCQGWGKRRVIPAPNLDLQGNAQEEAGCSCAWAGHDRSSLKLRTILTHRIEPSRCR